MLKSAQIRKVSILGTTGSGKTSFLSSVFGDFNKSDVERRVGVESADNYDFVPIKDSDFSQSTTTVSLNVVDSIMCLTTHNTVVLEKMKNKEDVDYTHVDDAYQVVFNDPAGQDRFSFMQEIAVRGADLVIIMADGTNISSLQKIVEYISLVRDERERTGKEIPIMIFVNKADLKKKGVYLGKRVAEDIADSELNEEIPIYETSNLDPATFLEPFRMMMANL